MSERLQQVVEYRRLAAKRDAGRDEDLAPGDWYRLAALGDLLPRGVPSAGGADSNTRLDPPLNVALSVGGQRLAGTLRDLTVDGLGVAVDPPPPLGARATVYVAVPHARADYQFAGRIVGRVVKGATSVSIALDGETRLMPRVRQTSGVWRSDDAEAGASGVPPAMATSGRKATEGS